MNTCRKFCVSILLMALLLAAGCGGASNSMVTPTPVPPASTQTVTQGSANLNVTLVDAPPSGVAVVSFEISIDSVVLQPGNLSVLPKSMRVEITKLQAETAFLNAKDIPAGSYTGATISFSNPELTFVNNTGAAIGTCAVGSTCTIHPNLGATSVNLTSSPFPLTVQANQPLGLQFDFDLANSILANLSVTPTVTAKQITAPPAGTPMHDIKEVNGTVVSVDAANNKITIQAPDDPTRTLTFSVDANTVFKDFTNVGLPNALGSVAAKQVIEVDLNLMAGGALIAKSVELRVGEHETEGELRGVVVSVGSASQFKIAISDESADDDDGKPGAIFTVTLNTDSKFTKDDLDLVIPSGAQFAGPSDLMVGQRVLVRPAGGSSGNLSTSSVRLLTSVITARVTSITGANFMVDNLPALFNTSNPSVTTLQVNTSPKTDFDGGISGVNALSVGDQVSFAGLLFKGTPPVVAAKSVRKRH